MVSQTIENSHEMKNVVIIEEDPRLANLLRRRINLSKKYRCEHIFPSPASFLNTKVKPDILLMDIIMPETDGISAIAAIQNKYPEVYIIVHSVRDDADTIFGALKMGAVGYIDKQSFEPNFEEVFECILHDGAYITPKIARKIVQYFRSPKVKMAKLTPRESDVAREILNGLSYKMVGDKLGISIDTVRMNIKRIYRKLNINSKGELFQIMSNSN
jgi:DNA-binding NarL/FixJ family response regulator